MKMIFAILVVATPAHAVDMLPYYETPKVEKVSHVSKAKPKAKKSKPRKSYSFRPAPAVEAPKLASDAVARCLPPVRVVGSQDIRPDAAEQSAIKAWAETVRWSSGEAYQDWQNAKGYQKRCSRSSIGEALGQYFTRCEVSASPCRPGMVDGGAK